MNMNTTTTITINLAHAPTEPERTLSGSKFIATGSSRRPHFPSPVQRVLRKWWGRPPCLPGGAGRDACAANPRSRLLFMVRG